MQLNDYAKAASVTAVYPINHAIEYLSLGLAGEVGEFCNGAKKILRGDYDGDEKAMDAAVARLRDELGDILWYWSQLPEVVGTTAEDVAARNLFKLAERSRRGTVKGTGDAR